MPPKTTSASLPTRTQPNTETCSLPSPSDGNSSQRVHRAEPLSESSATRSRPRSATPTARSDVPSARRRSASTTPSASVCPAAANTLTDAHSSSAPRGAPKIRFSVSSASNASSRRTSVIVAPTPTSRNDARLPTTAGADSSLSSSLAPVLATEERSARRRGRGLSLISSVSSSFATQQTDGGHVVPTVSATTDSARFRGHPFALRPTSPQTHPTASTPPRAPAEVTEDSNVMRMPSPRAALPEPATVPSGSPPADHVVRDGADESEFKARCEAPPTATPPHHPRALPADNAMVKAPDSAVGAHEEEANEVVEERGMQDVDNETIAEFDEPLLVDTTGHSPIPQHLQRRVAHEQRRERERIRRRLNPSARTLRVSARLRPSPDHADRRASVHESAPQLPVPFDLDALAQSSPRALSRDNDELIRGWEDEATAELPQPDRAVPTPAAHPARPAQTDDPEAEPEPSPPVPTAVTPAECPDSTTISPMRVFKSPPSQCHPRLSSDTAPSVSRSEPRASTTMTAGPAEGPQATASTAPVAHVRSVVETRKEAQEPCAEPRRPQPVPRATGITRTVLKNGAARPCAVGEAANKGPTTVAAGRERTAQPTPAAAHNKSVGATASPALSQNADQLGASAVGRPHGASSTSVSFSYVSKMKRKPGATMTRLKRDGAASSASAVPIHSVSASVSAGPPTPGRVMKAPDSILQAASESRGSPMRSVGCVPSISAGQDLLPPLCASDQSRTLTIVFDLDETMCNNRILGPALLRPGVLAMLDDLRALCPPPTYSDNVAAKPSATARLYEQAVARQLGCGPASSPSYSGRARRDSTSPPPVPPTSSTALHPLSWSDAEYAVGPRVELLVWTASVESVARPVIARLDPDGNIFDHCIFRDPRWYREVSYTKDLRRLGRPMEHVMIVENAPSAVSLNRTHAILVNDFVNNRNDRQLYAVRAIVRDWIERARLSVHLPPRRIGSVGDEAVPAPPSDAVDAATSANGANAPTAITASARHSITSDKTSDGVVIHASTLFLASHPYMNVATGYVSLPAVRQAVQLFRNEVPRRRERGSRASGSRSGSSSFCRGGETSAAASYAPVARPGGGAKAGLRNYLRKRSAVQMTVLSTSTVSAPNGETTAPPTRNVTNTGLAVRQKPRSVPVKSATAKRATPPAGADTLPSPTTAPIANEGAGPSSTTAQPEQGEAGSNAATATEASTTGTHGAKRAARPGWVS